MPISASITISILSGSVLEICLARKNKKFVYFVIVFLYCFSDYLVESMYWYYIIQYKKYVLDRGTIFLSKRLIKSKNIYLGSPSSFSKWSQVERFTILSILFYYCKKILYKNIHKPNIQFNFYLLHIRSKICQNLMI